MNILLIVNASPWGSTLAATALRFFEAACVGHHRVPAVYFRGEGVYNAMTGRQRDPGAVDLAGEWVRLSQVHGAELLLCSAAAGRRFVQPVIESTRGPFKEAGLATMLEWAASCDRVVSF